MFKERTVIILGAGASIDYGYPTGRKLREQIISSTSVTNYIVNRINNSTEVALNAVLNSDIDFLTFIALNCHISTTTIERFNNDFRMSPKNSIDSFLENRPEFIDIGKLLISKLILDCEDEQMLRPNSESESWYAYLFNFMAKSWNDFTKNKVIVATYNYDRSFEVFFIKALMATFGKSEKECAKAFSQSVNVIHIHGQVAGTNFINSTKNYNKSVTGTDILWGAKNLKIIHEQPTKEIYSEDVYSLIHDCLSNCSKVFILGFGYHDTNLRRLELERYSIPIYSTRYGVTDLEVDELIAKTARKVKFSQNPNSSIVDFFKNEVSLNGTSAQHMRFRLDSPSSVEY